MSRRLFVRGDRVRLLTLTAGGWLGEGIVIEDQEPDGFTVTFEKAGADLDGTARVFAHWAELELVECSTLNGSTDDESL